MQYIHLTAYMHYLTNFTPCNSICYPLWNISKTFWQKISIIQFHFSGVLQLHNEYNVIMTDSWTNNINKRQSRTLSVLEAQILSKEWNFLWRFVRTQYELCEKEWITYSKNFYIKPGSEQRFAIGEEVSLEKDDIESDSVYTHGLRCEVCGPVWGMDFYFLWAAFLSCQRIRKSDFTSTNWADIHIYQHMYSTMKVRSRPFTSTSATVYGSRV